jgi:nitroreductase
MTWDENPKTFMIATVAAAVAAALASLTAAVVPERPAFAVVAAALSLVAGVLGYQTWAVGRRRRLTVMQRGSLVAELRRLAGAHLAAANGSGWDVRVRVAAADDPEARAFAAQLRDALVDAGWAARGIFRAPSGNGSSANGHSAHDAAGGAIVVAVQGVAFAEAYELQLALEQLGFGAVGATKPTLAPREIEVLVARTP